MLSLHSGPSGHGLSDGAPSFLFDDISLALSDFLLSAFLSSDCMAERASFERHVGGLIIRTLSPFSSTSLALSSVDNM